jgi:hypothetical protein
MKAKVRVDEGVCMVEVSYYGLTPQITQTLFKLNILLLLSHADRTYARLNTCEFAGEAAARVVESC